MKSTTSSSSVKSIQPPVSKEPQSNSTQTFSVDYSRVKNSEKNYNQERQTFPCKFAYVKVEEDKVFILHAPILCRDYLLDTFMWREKLVAPTRIYGYDFNGDYDPNFLWVDKLPNLEKNINFFWEWEDKLGVPRTQVFKCDDGHLFKGDDQWVNSTLKISLWTWMIRNWLYPPVPVMEEAGVGELQLKKIFDLPFSKHVVDKKWFSDKDIYHSYNGFLSVITPWKKAYTVYGNY